MEINTNLLAILAGAIANMVIGFLWYGPIFGKMWMKLSNISEKDIADAKSQMGKTYTLSMLAALVMAFVLGQFVEFAGVSTIVEGAWVGFWAWLGFVATTMLNGVLFERKSWKLYYLNAGYYLVSLPVMGAILAVWG